MEKRLNVTKTAEYEAESRVGGEFPCRVVQPPQTDSGSKENDPRQSTWDVGEFERVNPVQGYDNLVEMIQ